MKPKDLRTVVNFYENVIQQQIIKPIECEEAYRLVKPDGPAVPYFQKMRAISIYVQGLQQEVLNDLEQLFDDFDEEQQDLAKDTKNPMSKDFDPSTLDSTDTVEPVDSAASPNGNSHDGDNQSHKEGDVIDISIENDEGEMVTGQGVIESIRPTYVKVSQPMDEPMTELQRLEMDYEKATTANEKRSLKMRINKLKKNN